MWSSVRVVPGVLSVMMLGELMMPLWSVDSWDLLKSVCFVVFFAQSSTLFTIQW